MMKYNTKSRKNTAHVFEGKKRCRIAFLCLLMSLFVFTGCAGKDKDSSSNDSASGGSADTAADGGGTDALPGSGELQAVFFDVGKGDCILLTMGEDHVLLDAGYEETWLPIVKQLKARGVDSLDAMIITHYDKDHVGGAAEIAQEIPVDMFYLPDYEGEENKCGDLLDLIERKGLESVHVTEKEEISLGQAQIEVDPALIQYNLQEENDNDASLIVKVFYEEDEWLLPGDIEKDAIAVWLGENTQTFDILKMPHHGGKEKNTKELIENADPEIAVITDSTVEEASEKVLKQLEKRDIEVYRSSVNGTITITGKGTGEYEVSSEK